MNALHINEFILTRLLYIKDEVIHMCLTSLLKQDLHQTIFWFHELYFSHYQHECFQILYTFYYLFYSYINPKFDKYFQKHYNIWTNDQNFEHLVTIIFNLIKCNFSFDLFIMYNFIKSLSHSHITFTSYKGRKPLFLNQFNPSYHNLIHSLYKNDLYNFCISLHSLHLTKDIYDAIIYYFIHVESINDIKADKIDFYYNSFINNSLDNELLKYILSTVLLCKSSSSRVNLKNLYISLNCDIKEYINDLSNYDDIPLYRFLYYKRLYPIDPNIATFHLSRFDIKLDLSTLLTHDWLYYASKCPLWNTILNNFTDNWYYNHNDKTISFSIVEEEEEFYNLYCLEHDEQPYETQQKCTINCLHVHPNEFINSFHNKFDFIDPSTFINSIYNFVLF